MYSMSPLAMQSDQLKRDTSLSRSLSMCSFLSSSDWSSTIRIGRQHRPASEKRRSSRAWMSRTMDTSAEMSTPRRIARSVLTSWSGWWWMPTQAPLTKTFVAAGMAEGWISSRFSVAHSSRNSRMGSGAEPTEMYAIRERFLTSPTACPSGVSAGQTMPQCVLCSWRGLASLPSLPIGVLSRRRCERVEAKVSRLRTCETPARIEPGALFCWPQLPVARAYLSPLEMVLCCTAATGEKSWPLSMHFWPYFCTSLESLRKSCRKSWPRSGPARSSRFCAKWSRSSGLRAPIEDMRSLWTMYPTK
mmetsp:Transcript_30596/g.90860  ORF Transcript_30596/g.90860 Transcript_30596/m.90860 type:complete len:303 (+) Transcript_30596:1263-2171(+)